MSVIDRLTNRVTGLIAKALVNAVIDTGEIQLVKVSTLNGATFDGVERLQQYGESSSPPPGSEAIALNINGDMVVIVCDSGAYRVKDLFPGEKAIYSMFGQIIHLTKTGAIDITAPAGVSIGAGSDAVAMSTAVTSMWNALKTALDAFPGGTPDAGAALSAALSTAISTALAANTIASTNTKAD